MNGRCRDELGLRSLAWTRFQHPTGTSADRRTSGAEIVGVRSSEAGHSAAAFPCLTTKSLLFGQPEESSNVTTRVDPRPASTRKLHGAEDLWRVIYAIDDAKHLIDVRVVRHRKDAYR